MKISINDGRVLNILFEKHLFSREHLNKDTLFDDVTNDYIDYCNKNRAFIRQVDEVFVREIIYEELLDLYTRTVGMTNDIEEFLNEVVDLDKKQKKAKDNYLKLYIDLEEKYYQL